MHAPMTKVPSIVYSPMWRRKSVQDGAFNLLRDKVERVACVLLLLLPLMRERKSSCRCSSSMLAPSPPKVVNVHQSQQ